MAKRCAKKVRYATYEAAARAIALSRGLADKPARAYQCPHCGGWHVSSHSGPPRRAK